MIFLHGKLSKLVATAVVALIMLPGLLMSVSQAETQSAQPTDDQHISVKHEPDSSRADCPAEKSKRHKHQSCAKDKTSDCKSHAKPCPVEKSCPDKKHKKPSCCKAKKQDEQSGAR